MKFAFVIATLFAASAIAAPCVRRHVDDVADVPATMDESNAMDDTPAPTAMDDNSPMDETPMDETPAMDSTPVDDSLSSTPPPQAASMESMPDTKDELKTSAPGAGKSDNSQTAVINNNSPDKGGKGSLFGLDTSAFLEDGILGGTDNVVDQHH